MTDPKLRKIIMAALDAGDAMFAAVYDNPEQMSWDDVLALVKQQHKAIKAARRAMAKDTDRG